MNTGFAKLLSQLGILLNSQTTVTTITADFASFNSAEISSTTGCFSSTFAIPFSSLFYFIADHQNQVSVKIKDPSMPNIQGL